MALELEIVAQPGYPTSKIREALSNSVAAYIEELDKKKKTPKDISYEINNKKESVITASFKSEPEKAFDSPEFFAYVLNALGPFDLQALRTGQFTDMW